MLKTTTIFTRHFWKRTIATRPHVTYDDQTKSFVSVFPEVVDTIVKSELFRRIPKYQKHFVDALHYNVMKEKRFRPPLLIETYKILEKPKDLTDKSLHLMNILAWCLEIIATYMNVEDDTMDQTSFRCDDVCWHKKENVGLTAFRDSMFFYEAGYVLLEKYFCHKPTMVQFINLFQEMNQRLAFGQSLDWHLRMNENLDLSTFDMNLFLTIGRNKGGFPIIDSPFQAACILSNNYDKYIKVKDLIQKISYMFQIDNDVLDVFQNGTAKIDAGENIRHGQCTWLAIQVLENGNDNVKQIFKENYGKTGTKYENKIIGLYSKMNLYDKYVQYRNENLKHIKGNVKNLNDLSLQLAILNLYDKIFL